MGSLRVHVTYDNGSWFAQGMEVDYAAQGTSQSEAKEHFERGLRATVLVNTEKGRRPTDLLRIADSDAWSALYDDATKGRLRPEHRATDAVRLLPFDRILYLIQTGGGAN